MKKLNRWNTLTAALLLTAGIAGAVPDIISQPEGKKAQVAEIEQIRSGSDNQKNQGIQLDQTVKPAPGAKGEKPLLTPLQNALSVRPVDLAQQEASDEKEAEITGVGGELKFAQVKLTGSKRKMEAPDEALVLSLKKLIPSLEHLKGDATKNVLERRKKDDQDAENVFGIAIYLDAIEAYGSAAFQILTTFLKNESVPEKGTTAAEDPKDISVGNIPTNMQQDRENSP